jgi:hypothetical protein
MKIILLLLLFVLGFGTPSLAQQCIADTVDTYSDKDGQRTYVLASGAVYREQPTQPDDFNNRFATIDDMEPWIGQSSHVWICGDQTLLYVNDPKEQCRVGLDCEAMKPSYYLIPVTCLRRCFATKQR